MYDLYRGLVVAVLVWKVWFDTGAGLEIYHSKKHRWEDIPNVPGVQVILVCEDEEWKKGRPYRRLIRGADWYGLVEGEPVRGGGGEDNGKWIEQPWLDAKAGKTIDTKVYERYIQEAWEDKTCAVQ